MPEGKSYVFSDTFGLVSRRVNRKQCLESQLSKACPDVMRLLCRWMKDNLCGAYDIEFPFTSINLNFGYNAKLHRDSGNVGPSLLRALGDFTGGHLGYYPDDDKGLNIEQLKCLPSKHVKKFDISKKFHLIDGNRGHFVDAFKGERFSVVFFSCRSFKNATPAVRKSLVKCGVRWPSTASMKHFQQKLNQPNGCTALTAKLSASRSAKRKAYCVGKVASPPPPLKERKVEKLNTEGDKFKLLGFPHLDMHLTLGNIYSTGNLVKRCHGNIERLTALRRKLRDRRIFQPVSD